MSKPKEEDLREAKHELIAGLNQMQRDAGVLPDTRKSESIVDPVIHKVSRDEVMTAPITQPRRDKSELKPGDWFGEPEHSGKIPDSVAGEKVTFFARELGDYAIGPNGKHDVRPLNGAPTGQRRFSPFTVATIDGISMTEEMVRDLTRMLWTKKEWRRRIKAAVNLNDYHRKQKRMEAIFSDAFRVFGPPIPRAMVPKKIIVS